MSFWATYAYSAADMGPVPKNNSGSIDIGQFLVNVLIHRMSLNCRVISNTTFLIIFFNTKTIKRCKRKNDSKK